jgi:hypothetical protein
MQRLIGLLPPGIGDPENATFETIRAGVEALIGTRVTDVNWFSTYRVHHRVAERFRQGRAFILGDAAHIHSPAGGQGMNTGIGDATNLGWKIADTLRGNKDPEILDSFEEERIGFARALVATTDRLFTSIVRGGTIGEFTRQIVAPIVFTVGTRFPLARHAFFRTLSQTAVSYAGSMLSAGHAGTVRGGDRLPWVGACDNFASLRSLDWQIHVYGSPSAGVATLCERTGVALHVFAWSDAARAAGFARDAAYLVRPDGYVALAAARDATAKLEAYLARIHIGRGR